MGMVNPENYFERKERVEEKPGFLPKVQWASKVSPERLI